jgi:hypothetical protein
MTNTEIRTRLLQSGLSAVRCGLNADLVNAGWLVVSHGKAPFSTDGQIVLAEDDCGGYSVLRYSYDEDNGTKWEDLSADADPFYALHLAHILPF